MNEPLAIDSGGYLRMNTLRALNIAWLNVSQRSRGGGTFNNPGNKM